MNTYLSDGEASAYRANDAENFDEESPLPNKPWDFDAVEVTFYWWNTTTTGGWLEEKHETTTWLAFFWNFDDRFKFYPMNFCRTNN